MGSNKPIVVTATPPWYYTTDYKNGFSCVDIHGLFDRVVELMVMKQEGLSEREKRYNPKNVYKTIRSMVIQDAATIEQKPSHSLLLALMDLVEIEGGNDFQSMAGVDRAGLKHVLLAYGNYTAYHIPNKELVSSTGKKMIPVVTQYSEKHNLIYYDSSRSMIGTYAVEIPKTGKDGWMSYFIQEVLFVPGHKSLELLKLVTGDKYEFWDMALEVPTHFKGITPSFQQIQSFQLLRNEDRPLSTQSNNDALTSCMEEIHPMCCVVGVHTAAKVKKRREASLDFVTENQVICDLTHFHYKEGSDRTVYFRKSGKVLEGKRVNMIPVVVLKDGQAQAPKLFVSTTLRFCRAVKQCCVKGNGELVSCWNDTLKELERDSFITGTEMYQEIHNPALAAFIKRVNPNSWCNHMPRHMESMIRDPVMIEVVELAIKFMDSKIPNAFAVAELLYCPIEKVQRYLQMWNLYTSNESVHNTVQKKRISMVEEQMRMDWAALADITSRYVKKKNEHGNINTVMACEELFKQQTQDNVTKLQKKWYSLVKHDASKIKNKELVQMYANSKVLFLKLRTYQNKIKKMLKAGEGQSGDPQSRSSSPHATEAQEDDVLSRCRVGSKEHSTDIAGVSEKDDSLNFIITPEPVPISTWLKNMATLLLSEPWLNDDNIRREAVCTLLGLDNILLDRRYSDILRDWVISNRTIVIVLQSYGLQDRLSKALIDCLESTSTDKWKHKVLLSFCGTQDRQRGHSGQPVCNQSNVNNHAKGSKSKQPSKQHPSSKVVGESAKKETLHHSKAVKPCHLASKTKSPVSDSKSHKNRDSGCDSSPPSYNAKESIWLSEANEVASEEEEACETDEDIFDEDILGEDLEATLDYDNSESSDEYDYEDSFINDESNDVECSSDEEEEEEKAFCAQSRAKRAKCKTKNVNRRRKYKRVSHSESEEEDHLPTMPVCGGMTEEKRLYERTLQSESEEEANKPDRNVNRRRKYKRVSHSESGEEDHLPKPVCGGMTEEKRLYKRTLQSESEEESAKPDRKRVKRTKESLESHKSKEKRSRGTKPVEESVQRFDREHESPTKKKQDMSDKNGLQSTMKTRTPMQDYPIYKRTPKKHSPIYNNKLLHSSSDSEGEEKQGGGIERQESAKLNCTHSLFNNTTDQEVRRPRKTNQRVKSDTPRQKRENTKSLEQQGSHAKQEHSNQVGASPHLSPGPSPSQGKKPSGDAADKLTNQSAAAPTSTLQQESSDQEGEEDWGSEEEPLHKEDQPTAHPAAPNVDSSEDDDSDVDSDLNARLQARLEETCSEPDTDSDDKEYVVCM